MAAITYGSVCSGIEAATAAWHSLGWKPSFFSEIEKFPSAVLKHHYPDVPNQGDMTKFEEWPDAAIDLLVGGTPCQSFSVAGLRKGLSDPRGNLTLTFLAVAQKYKPAWIVWENVPGILSDKTMALKSMLDALQQMGYIVDIDILDAQFFGVPQRRRRVFICAQHRDDLLSRTTPSSALTIAQCLVEILHGICLGQLRQYEREPARLVQASLSKDGITQRMNLFGITREKCNFLKLQNILIEAFQKFQRDAKSWGLADGASAKARTADDLLTAFETGAQFILTEESLKNALDESYEVMKSFITSTPTKTITNQQTYMCSKAVLLIGRLICRLRRSCPPSWQAGQSFLTAIQDFTNYARQTDRNLFGQLCGVHSWHDFVRETRPIHDAVGHLGDWRPAAAVLFERDSLQGNPAPRREKGKASPTIPSRSSAGGGLGTDFDCDGGLIASTGNVSHCLNAGGMGRQDYESETLITHSLRGEGFDASEDGTGRGIPYKGGGELRNDDGSANGFGVGKDGDPFPTLGAHDIHAVGVSLRGRDGSATAELGDGISNALRASGGGGDKQHVMTRMAVRRLTPRECERLQGFPDDYSLVPYRGKPAADGPRYKALGNSMAVPVMRWIGRRIADVDSIRENHDRPAAAGDQVD